jgi:hypothetical protein
MAKKTRDFEDVLVEFRSALSARIEESKGTGEGYCLLRIRDGIKALDSLRRTEKRLDRPEGSRHSPGPYGQQ